MRALLLVLSTLLSTAHGDTGTFEVVETSTSELSAHYLVELRYADDGEAVESADVVLSATGPDGGAVGPVPMAALGDGRYEATVTFPSAGVWGVRISSDAPTAVVEQTSTVGIATTTASPTTTTSSTSTTEREATTTTESDDDESAGGGVRPGSVIAVGIAAVAIAFVLRRQRDRQRGEL